MGTRKAVFPDRPHALYREHGYSPAIQSGDLLFVSGMVGAREDGTPEPDLEAQVRSPSTTSRRCSTKPAARSTTWSTPPISSSTPRRVPD